MVLGLLLLCLVLLQSRLLRITQTLQFAMFKNLKLFYLMQKMRFKKKLRLCLKNTILRLIIVILFMLSMSRYFKMFLVYLQQQSASLQMISKKTFVLLKRWLTLLKLNSISTPSNTVSQLRFRPCTIYAVESKHLRTCQPMHEQGNGMLAKFAAQNF